MFDFIRKKSPNANPTGDASSVAPTNAPSMPQTVSPVVSVQTDSTITEAQSAMPVPPRNQSYNGIGNPPGGQSYNGIGNPPSGKSFNGIGSTPSGQAPYNGIGNAPKKDNPNSMMEIGMDADEKKASSDIKKSDADLSPKDSKGDIKGDSLKSNISNTKRNELDVMTHLTQRSNKVFVEANNKAKAMKNSYMDSEHLLHGLLSDGQIYNLMIELKVQPQAIEEELNKNYKVEQSTEKPQISPRVKQIVSNSLIVARKTGYEFVSPEHLLLALFEEGEGLGARILVKLGVKKEDLNKKVTGKKEGLAGKEDKAQQKQKSALEQYTIDLTAKAANGELDPVVERSEVIERVVHILSRRIKNNPALIGEPGVGKTAVVEGLAERIVSKEVPESLLSKRILQLDLSAVVAGASHRGEFEERMKNVVDELKGAKGEIIMFIDEMHTMMGAGAGDGAIDASNFIKPALARGEVQFIGATTITEYRKYIEKDAALERRFQTVLVPEPSIEAAIKMLKAVRDKYEAFHKVKISDEVIDLCVKLSKRYIGDRFLPDKGFDLMDEGAAAVRLPLISLPEEIKSLEDRVAQLNQEVSESEKSGEKVKARIARSKIDDIDADLKTKKDEYAMKKASTTTEVTPEIIKDLIAKRTGIPLSKISAKEGDNLVNLEDIIHKRMIDQESAVKSVSQAIRRGRAGLKSTTRPIGSFVFLGPTGVGKTELAKTISEVLFDEEDAVIRFDMTEYMERHEVAKLLGPPPGYVGFEEGGKLTEMVRRKPYSVVLFDEVEKAHPDIFNILLQILDDGRLTDNKGRTISFKNTVVICTSNIGTRLIQQEMLKSGNTDVSEPTMVSTYVFTPRGREILTIGNKYYERDGANAQALQNQISATNTPEPKLDNMPKPTVSWADHVIADYFAGQKVEGTVPVEKKAEEPVDGMQAEEKELTNEAATEYAKQEMKSVGFPMMGYDTQAISAMGKEIVTKGNTVYSRSATTAKVWNVTTLIEYFKDNVVINALPDAPDEQLPTVRLKTHAFTPDEQEIVTFKDRYWRRKANSTDWETGTLKDYFRDQKADADIQFPVTHWDIHAFSPAGREIIVVGNDIWFHDAAQPWKKFTLDVYFGGDFPLDKVMTEKQKLDDDTDKKKYQLIKDKVMNELLKFFRPELVNRFDEVIIFEPLKFIHMIEIVRLQLKGLSKLLEEQEMGFSATDTAIKEIVRSGFDPLFGARPLRRAIQRLVENPISELIIAKKVQAGDTIIVDFNGEEFVFNVEKIDRKAMAAGAEVKGATGTKTFFCEKCANTFTTEVTDHSTTICSKCGSRSLQEINDQKKESMEPTVSGLETDPKPIAEKKETTNPSGQPAVPPADPGANLNLAADVNTMGMPN
jgi:ATP-dependent Clp protease ATP-binding subunit ClpC